VWKPDFTDALEDEKFGLVPQTERPFVYRQPEALSVFVVPISILAFLEFD
jgi:hypothetical protein